MGIAPVRDLSVASHAAAASGGAIAPEEWMARVTGPGLAAVGALLAPPLPAAFAAVTDRGLPTSA